MLNRLSYALALVLFCAAPGSAEQSVEMRVVSIPTTRVLTVIGKAYDQRIVTSAAVGGTIRDATLKGELPKVLDDIAAAHDLTWFTYNNVVYVSSKSEAVTRVLPLEGKSITEAEAALVASGIDPERGYIRPAANGSALSVFGSPSFVGLVEAVLKVTPGIQDVPPPDLAVRVRRGVETQLEYFGSTPGGTPVQPSGLAAKLETTKTEDADAE